MRKLHLFFDTVCNFPFLITISAIKMDLVCEEKGFIEASQSMFMAGCLIGSLLFGVISDKYVSKASVLK